jgi:hypothetical protein
MGASVDMVVLSGQYTTEDALLSFAQESHHVNATAHPDRERQVYFSARIDGELDVAALLSAVRELVQRHDALRLRVYAAQDGTLRQAASAVPAGQSLVRCVELVNAAPDQFDRYARKSLRELVRRPWYLTDEMSCRFLLLRHSAHRHALLGAFSPLTVDERSRRLLIPELWEAYVAFHTGVQPEEARDGAQPTRFLDAARLQRSRFGRRAGTSNARYWRVQEAELADLGTGNGHSATTEPGGGRSLYHELVVGRERLDALRRECDRRGLGISHWLFGQFLVAVFAVVDSDWLVVDFPVDLRGGPDNDTVGMFVLSVPVVVRRRADLAGQIENLRSGLLGAMVHCHAGADAMAGFRELAARRCAQENVPRLAASHSYFELEGGRCLEPAGLAVEVSAYNPVLSYSSRGADLRVDEFPNSMLLQVVLNEGVLPGMAAADVTRRLVEDLGGS